MSRHALLGCALLVAGAATLGAQWIPPEWQARLVQPGTGWLWQNNQLLWRETHGAEWRDITPPLTSTEQKIAGVFFLDARHGWCLLHDFRAEPDGRTALEITSTDDGGRSWIRVALADSDAVLRLRYGGDGELVFTDSLNGWLKLTLMSSSASSCSSLLRTSDGGRTWTRLPDPPANGVIGFLPSGFGWLAGGVLDDKLYLTPDGGRSWVQSEVGVACPKADYVQVNYLRPRFKDSQHGILPVRVNLEDQTQLRIYSTRDGGASWQAQRTEEINSQGGFLEPAVVDGRAFIAKSAPSGGVEFWDGTSSFPLAMPAILQPESAITQMDFADALNGWMIARVFRCTDPDRPCSFTHALLATVDGGHTLNVIYTRHTPLATKPRYLQSQ